MINKVIYSLDQLYLIVKYRYTITYARLNSLNISRKFRYQRKYYRFSVYLVWFIDDIGNKREMIWIRYLKGTFQSNQSIFYQTSFLSRKVLDVICFVEKSIRVFEDIDL